MPTPKLMPPLTAMCVLCADVDAHRDFYTDILGLAVNRREDGFVNFKARDGMAICLWEIGHIHRHLGYPVHAPSAIVAKSIVALPVGSAADVDALAGRCRARHVEIVAGPGVNRHGEYALMIADPNRALWEIVVAPQAVNPDAAGSNARRLTLIADDLAATRRFFGERVELVETRATPRLCVYACERGAELELLARDALPGRLGAALNLEQRRAHLVMGAFGYVDTAKVDALYHRLSARGVPFSGPAVVHAWKFHACYFTDPDANIWEIYAPVRADIGTQLLG